MGRFHHAGTSTEAVEGDAEEPCCAAPLITHGVIITCHNECCRLELSLELIIILQPLS